MVIFLDFDGVLHPRPTDGRGIFCHLPAFENVAREFPFVKIVISSSWREVYPFDVLVEIFSSDIQSKIIGATPIVREATSWPRQNEIIHWLMMHAYQGRWIALDDEPNEFPPQYSNLLCCKSAIGFDVSCAQQLRERLASFDNV